MNCNHEFPFSKPDFLTRSTLRPVFGMGCYPLLVESQDGGAADNSWGADVVPSMSTDTGFKSIVLESSKIREIRE